jgi:hypothetical protein
MGTDREDFPDLVGFFLARNIIQESGSIVLGFSNSSGKCRIIFGRAMFLFADIEIGEKPPIVISCSVRNRPERRDSLKKEVEIKFDSGTLLIAYDKCAYVQSAVGGERVK